MRLLVLATCLTIAGSAFAQVRPPRGQQVARIQQLVDEVSYLSVTNVERLNRRQLERLETQLSDARQTLLAASGDYPLPPTNPFPNPEPVPAVNLECTSRDNDNRAPYVYSYIARDFSVIKLGGASFASLASCNESLDTRNVLLGTVLSCTSRDGDGRAPYSMLKFLGTEVQKLSTLTFATLQGCRDVIDRSVIINRSEVAFCKDRDSDNRAPYVMRKLNVDSGVFSPLNNNSFNSLAECERVLSSR